MSDTRTVRIVDIKLGKRFRKDFGDIPALAKSIAVQLLHPPVVDAGLTLVCGERRIKAAQHNGWTEMPVRVLDIDDLLEMEHDENELRKDFTPSERVEIGRAIEAKTSERRGNPLLSPIRGNSSELGKGQRTGDVAAEAAGFGSRDTYRQAASVVDRGTPELIEAMDKGEVSINAASEVAKLPKDEQKKIVAEGPKAVKKAASKKRQNNSDDTPKPDIKTGKGKMNKKTDVQTGQANTPAPAVDMDALRQSIRAEVMSEIEEKADKGDPAKHVTKLIKQIVRIAKKNPAVARQTAIDVAGAVDDVLIYDEPAKKGERRPVFPFSHFNLGSKYTGPTTAGKQGGGTMVWDAYNHPVPDRIAGEFTESKLLAIARHLERSVLELDAAGVSYSALSERRQGVPHFLTDDWNRTIVKGAKLIEEGLALWANNACPFALCRKCFGQADTPCKACQFSGYWGRAEAEDNPTLCAPVPSPTDTAAKA